MESDYLKNVLSPIKIESSKIRKKIKKIKK